MAGASGEDANTDPLESQGLFTKIGTPVLLSINALGILVFRGEASKIYAESVEYGLVQHVEDPESAVSPRMVQDRFSELVCDLYDVFG